MVEKTHPQVAPDYDTYIKNRCGHSLDELAQYGDEWVAWSADGTTVLAHHSDPLVVADRVKASGVDTATVHMEWIPPGGEVETLL